MPLTIQLLGRPGITRDAGEVYAFRSRKSWAVLAYLILGERPPSRSQLARLLSEQRRLAAAAEAILHEAALGSMSRGALQDAIGYAARAAAISPLDENHQALLIRLYRTAGDDEAAEKQYAACTAAFAAELGAAPGPVVQAALRETREVREEVADRTTIEAVIEAGSAAVSAGATEAGVHSLRT